MEFYDFSQMKNLQFLSIDTDSEILTTFQEERLIFKKDQLLKVNIWIKEAETLIFEPPNFFK